jgi:hypothetical protein
MKLQRALRCTAYRAARPSRWPSGLQQEAITELGYQCPGPHSAPTSTRQVRKRGRSTSNREIVKYRDNRDPITRRMMKQILAAEEEHADEMADLLGDLSR